MESKDYSLRNTPINTTSNDTNVKKKKSSEDLFVKNDPTLERTKSLSSKIAIDAYQGDDLEGHSVEKSDSHVDSSVLKFKEVNGQNQKEYSIFDNSDAAIEADYRKAMEYVSPNLYGVDSASSDEGDDFDSVNGDASESIDGDASESIDGDASESIDGDASIDPYAPESGEDSSEEEINSEPQTKEQKDDSRLTHLFEVCSSSLVTNLLDPDFKTPGKDPEKHKLYTDTVVTTINTSEHKEGVVTKLGAGSNKTTFATSFIYNEKSKSAALTSGSTDNIYLKTELTLAKKIREMKLKGTVKTYGIMESGNNFIIVSKKANMGTMRELEIDDKKGLSLLFDAHANIKEFHDRDISHNDIKRSNFLIHKGSKGKTRILLNDFGSSIISKKKEGARLFSQYVLDPYTFRNMDIVKRESYPQSDKYAYGLMIIEFLRRNSNAPIDTESNDPYILNTFAPWVSNKKMTDEECATVVNDLIENTPIPPEVPELHDFLKRVMAFNPADRPTNSIIEEQIAKMQAKLA